MVVSSYLNGEGSYIEIAKKFKIPSKETVRKWVLKYNGHEKLKDSRTGGSTIMTKGRKTTFDERVEIVQYCIAHNRNYAETSEKYQISYQQARNYTVKYESGGVEELKDNRGIRKPEDQMSELERLRAENRILRVEKDRAEMEVSFLKKLEEIERRRG
jgi:transposase-like protein